MASYQDIDTRLQTVERKLDFVMKAFTVKSLEGLVDKKVVIRTLLDIYYALQHAGIQQLPANALSEAPAALAQGDGDLSHLTMSSEA